MNNWIKRNEQYVYLRLTIILVAALFYFTLTLTFDK